MLKYFIFINIIIVNIFASNAFISPNELKNSLNNKNLIILDVSKKSIYQNGHIQNSIHADISKFIDKQININPENAQNKKFEKNIAIASKRVIQKELRNLGINNNSEIIIYDHNTKDGMSKSAYLAFVLIYSNFENVRILDGGYMSWVFQNQILVDTKVSNKINYGNIEVKIKSDLFINTSYLKDNISKIKILDARSPKHYFGILKSNTINKLGHIPKATSSFYKDKFHTDYTIRSQEDLNSIYLNGHELKNNDETIIYADNILNSSMEWFILYKQMGFKNTKIYKNSLFEWINKYELTRFKWE